MTKKHEEEAIAQALCSQCQTAGFAAEVRGAGVHQDVVIRARRDPHDDPAADQRAVIVHCFHYDDHVAGLRMGMNPGNARASLTARRPETVGAEFAVVLQEAGARQRKDRRVRGRTQSTEQVLAAAKSWLAGGDAAAVAQAAPFIDEERHAIDRLVAEVDTTLRREVKGDPGYEAWVYGVGRSACLKVTDGDMTCALWLLQAQVAFVKGSRQEVLAAVDAWLVRRVDLGGLGSLPAVTLERHAALIEQDPARWHWAHVRDRIASADDVLWPLRHVIAVLADSPIASRFFSFSSLDRFCFTSSSHYPWVCDGLPVIAPIFDRQRKTRRDDACTVDGEELSNTAAVERTESLLRAAPVAPFFGSEPHHAERRLTPLFGAAAGVVLELEQHDQWFRLIARAAPPKSARPAQSPATPSSRCCEVSERYVAFLEDADAEPGDRVWAVYPDDLTLVAAVQAWVCDDARASDVIASSVPGKNSAAPRKP